ncbi:PAS domain-containing sensor histidine kinase [Nitratifractor salsuginis]|uniref:histidine kinase n=1 Tax=Nitratifractor salsuginis (strain DSM 16511 / JCM 12458 / E9I37-1) TaxID=749222 RepID=E6X089_NITSE|nr:PAS domain S-box protein [Nitratifractor salsuginis]ADV45678.1 PAS/PAC sensor signal transduction histidine kinase [Nitratifractor salsuginis DSM 16511]
MLQQYIEAIESSNIVSRTDINGIITFANDEFCKISGYSREELIGKNHNIVRHPDVPAENFLRLWKTILAKKTYKATVKNLAKDGSTFYVNTTIVPILDQRGEIEEFVAIRYDVTREVELRMKLEAKERELAELNRNLEERVRQQTRQLQELNRNLEERVREEVAKNEEKQRMLLWQSRFASLGQMMANIAHQWRQPLTELNLSLYSLKEACRNDPDAAEELYTQSRKIIRSMSQTLDSFMDFFKPDRSSVTFPIHSSLEDALSLIRKALEKKRIRVKIEGDRSLRVTGIPNELTQVFVNLLQNAKEAFGESDDEERWLRIHLSRDENNAVIVVEDNAGGIPPEALERIFEPYFTTKHSSQGTGLGLFMSRMIVQKSFRGSMEAFNSLKGALFVIKIPLAKTISPPGETQ